MKLPFHFACPVCRAGLVQLDAEIFICPVHQAVYPRKEGIWRFLPPELSLNYQKFMQEYETVRSTEGRGWSNPVYYRSLPFVDLSGRFTSDWKIRARSFQSMLRSVVAPLEKRAGNKLQVLDLGAGNCWLSYRLSQRGHLVAAVDLQTNALDGLGAYVHYDQDFLPIQADFNHLPFLDSQADLLIFNASFHYSTSYSASLGEALRVLRPEGQIVIIDSPIYRDVHSGEEMVREREDQFQKVYGFASNAIPSENYLTYQRLKDLSRDCEIHWRLVSVFYGLDWAFRPIRARLADRREPAQFRIVVGQRAPEA